MALTLFGVAGVILYVLQLQVVGLWREEWPWVALVWSVSLGLGTVAVAALNMVFAT